MPNDDNPPKEDQYVDEKTNDTIRKFLGEAVKYADEQDETVDKKDVPEDKVEDKKVDAKPETPEIDIEEKTKEIKQDIVKRLQESFGLTEEEKQQVEDEGIVAPWVKEKRTPKSYEEVAEFSAELAEFKRKQAETQAAKDKQAKLEVEKKSQQQINELWDMQLQELRDSKLIPDIDDSIKDKMKKGLSLSAEDLKDPGIMAQRDLFNTMGEVAQQRRAEKRPVITNLKEIYYEHYKKPEKTRQPAGADAPVSGGRPGVATDEGQFKYSDIRGKSYYDILNEG